MFQKGFTTKPTNITNENQLDLLNDYIHDEFFCLDDILYSEEEGTVVIPFRRMFHDIPGRVIRNWILLKACEVDVIHSVITISNVLSYRFEDKAKIGTYSFVVIKHNDGVLLFDCEPELKLELTISKIEVECKDIEIKGKSRISSGLFGLFDTYTGKVINN